MLKTVKQRVIAASVLAYLLCTSVAALMGFYLGVEDFNGFELFGFKGMVLWLLIWHTTLIAAAVIIAVLWLIINWIFDGERNGTSTGAESDS